MANPQSLHIFCHVIDNLGDIGVCWRLSRQFAQEHGKDVTLWIDNLASLKKLCPVIDESQVLQHVDGITVRQWPQEDARFTSEEVGDMVIEAFACHLPESYVAAMAKRKAMGKPASVWLNLEYLSAEAWVDGYHGLPSPHPGLPLTKYFFFPGFTEKTGGLILERGLMAQRDAFQRDPQTQAHFFAQLGVSVPAGACTASLFCYPFAPVERLFQAMQTDDQPVICLVPEGVAIDPVSCFLQQEAVVGASATQGALTVQVIPFVDQAVYDLLLWSCDINFVRGEDSFVRAQWAGKPFVWQIYQQAENAHATKLDAFLGRYIEDLPVNAALALTRFHLAWNDLRDADGISAQWNALRESLPTLNEHGALWSEKLSAQSALSATLLQFAAKIG